MKMIKLDSGKLLNLSAISYISNTEMVAYFKQPVITNEDSFQTAKCFGIRVTKADIERIAASAANGEVADDEQRDEAGRKRLARRDRAAEELPILP